MLQQHVNYKNQGNSRAALKRKKKENKNHALDITSAKDYTILTNSEITSSGKTAKKAKKIRLITESRSNHHNEVVENGTAKAASLSSYSMSGISLTEKVFVADFISPPKPLKIDYSTLSSELVSYLLDFELTKFYANHWGKSVYHADVGSKKPNHLAGLIGLRDCKEMMQTHVFYLGKDIVMSDKVPRVESNDESDSIYSDESHENIDDLPEEVDEIEITSSEAWQTFSAGFSMQLLRPQIYNDDIWRLLSLLEIEFESVVTCTVQIMPPNGE